MKPAEAFTYFWMIITWVCGIAIAKGFWMTAACILVPPAAWVVVADYFIRRI